MTWTIEDLRRLDLRYAQEGVPMHQRPIRAATELLGANFSLGVGANPEGRRVVDAYREMIPEVRAGWPGMGTGLAVCVDQVRKVVASVIFGTVKIEVWKSLDFKSAEEWWLWCREDRDIAADSAFAIADLYDFKYGVGDLQESKPQALTLWHMAASNLEDAANALPTSFSVETVIQPICMVVELSLKAALVYRGADPNEFKGTKGHDIAALAARVSREIPHRDDVLMQTAISEFPPYVKSRYEPARLTRYKVVRLALAAQFVAASTARRLSQRDLAAKMESSEWPGARRSFFDPTGVKSSSRPDRQAFPVPGAGGRR